MKCTYNPNDNQKINIVEENMKAFKASHELVKKLIETVNETTHWSYVIGRHTAEFMYFLEKNHPLAFNALLKELKLEVKDDNA